MKNKIVTVLLVSVNIAPWWMLFTWGAEAELDLYCQVPFDIQIQSTPPMKLQGSIKTHYYPDRTAISFINGSLVKSDEENHDVFSWTINRRAEFTYQMNKNYVYSQTQEVHPSFGDNLPHALAEAYLFPTYKVQHRDYYQLTRLVNKDVIVSIAGMPRLYCHSQMNTFPS